MRVTHGDGLVTDFEMGLSPEFGAYVSRIKERGTKVTDHTNKYIKTRKKDIDRGTKGFSFVTFVPLLPLFPIGKLNMRVTNSCLVRHPVRHPEGSHA